MPEKTIASRIINKHDVESNWNSSSFVPQKGELVIYDIDSNHAYERFKIGDGVNTVPNLPWSSSQTQSMIALEENQDLNDCTPSYTGESVTYYTNSNALALTLSNCPTQVSFQLTSTCLAVTGRYVQTLQDINDNLYMRSCNSNVWTNWQLQTNSTGSYPEMEVGKALQLSRIQKISAGSTSDIGWWQVGKFDISSFTATYDNPSTIFLVNGIYSNQGDTTGADSGLIEIDARKTGNVFTDCNATVLAGNINPANICVVNNSTEIIFYYNLPYAYSNCKLTILSDEKAADNDPIEIFQFETSYYGSNPPSNCIYGVNRNEAGYAATLVPPHCYANTASTVTTGYYKIASCRLSGRWQELVARFSFMDNNKANNVAFPAEVILTVQARNYTDDTEEIRPSLYLISGANSYYLEHLYVSYPTVGFTSDQYPAQVELYYYNDNLSYDDIAVSLLYQVFRNRTDSSDYHWVLEESNTRIDSLPSDGVTNTVLSSIVSLSTDARRASADQDGNAIVNINQSQTITGRKTFTTLPYMQDVDATIADPPSSTTSYNYIDFRDNDDARIGVIGSRVNTDGTYGVYLQGGNGGQLSVVTDGDGNTTYRIGSSPNTSSDTTDIATTAWVRDVVPGIEVNNAVSAESADQLTTARTIRTNLASTSAASFNGTANVTPGVTGTLPITNGGTGLTSNPSILVNLTSTTAADVLQTSPRPGVTGTLPVARGGTGQTSLSNVTVGEATSDDEGNNIFDTYMGHWTVNELKDGTSSTDFNDYVEPGFYELIGSSSASMSNAPISSSNTSDSNGNWYMQVLRRGSTYVTQLAYSVRTDTAVAIRTLSNGTWTNWRLINEWNGNPMMAPPKARGNSSNTALTRYYKIATCQVNAKWQDCYARMEFFDYNHVNVNERGCGIDICARSTADTGVITIDGSLLYGDDNYLSKIYAVYTPTGTTYPKTVDLYFFCDNLAYQEIAVKIFYTRSRTGENTFTWDYSDSNLYIDTLPEGSTAVLLSDVITRTTLAADALTLNGVAASNYVTTNTAQTISGQKTYTAAQSYDGPVILMDEEVQRLRMGGSSKHAYLDFFYDGASNLTSNIYESASGTLNVNGNLFTRNGVATLRTNSTLAASPATSDDSTKIATTAWVKDQNYLDSIPGASQTVLGGVKVYTDSSGYLCIDTE